MSDWVSPSYPSFQEADMPGLERFLDGVVLMIQSIKELRPIESHQRQLLHGVKDDHVRSSRR